MCVGTDVNNTKSSLELGAWEDLVPVSPGNDWERFKDEVLKDEGLKVWRELGTRGERF